MLLANQRGRYIYLFSTLAVITFIAHFWHYQSLGLYEDDYFLIGQPMSMDIDKFGEFLNWHLINFSATESRPLLYLIEFTLGLIGNLIQDFHTLYLINYLVILTANVLVYVFLKSIWNQPVFVSTGTLAFTLFPADTTHAYLTHVCLYVSLSFLTLAFLTYFANRKILSYLIIFASLFCYETVFPVFIAAPLFKQPWNKQLLKEIFKHALIMASMLALVFIARKLTGEARISQLDLITLISTPLSQMAIGPLVSLSMFFYQPAQTLLNFKGELLIFVPLCFVGFVLLLSSLNKEQESKVLEQNENDIFSTLKKLAFTAITCLVFAYPFNFTRAATEISGRNSRVHMAAAIGACILVGLLCYLIVNLAKSNLTKNLINGGLAVFFALLVGFGLTVQHENQKSWQYQQAFWTDVVNLCPDITPETVILVDAPNLNEGKQLHSFIQWGVPITFREIYKFPSAWARVEELPELNDKPRWFFWRRYTLYPKVYRLSDNWQETIVNDGKFDFDRQNPAFDYFLKWEPARLLDTNNIILLEEKNRQLVRRSEPLTINDKVFEFKKAERSTEFYLEKGVLYKSLIQENEEKLVSYFQ